jgi:hypothetical protein
MFYVGIYFRIKDGFAICREKQLNIVEYNLEYLWVSLV